MGDHAPEEVVVGSVDWRAATLETDVILVGSRRNPSSGQTGRPT
jgi:hypothetical protein